MPSDPSAPLIALHGASKFYWKGTQHDSLRDAIPALIRKLIGRNGRAAAHPDGFWALKDVNFEVRAGETLGILGPNGAGKSTILKLLSRIIAPTEGTFAIRGRLAALIELGGGFHPDLTGRENIYLQGTMLGLKLRDIRRMFDSIVAFSELESFLDTPVKRYSSGMSVRLGFAIAAHVNPDVLLLDEVLAVGDLSFQQKCLARIRQLKQQGKAMIFISHNLAAIEAVCDRALLLDHGQVKLAGSVHDVSQAYRELIVAQSRAQAARQSGDGDGTAGALTAGSAGVQILGLDILDHDGQPCEQVTTGAPCAIRIRYRTDRSIARPVFNVGIERLDAILCHAVSTEHETVLGPIEGEGAVTLTYAEFNLLPNTYWVSASLTEPGNHVPLAYAHHAGYFEVTADLPDRGAVHLEHSWTINQGRVNELASNELRVKK